ncbi:23S rRNA (uracil(747)-C(5))-methyltransferase RlmC [Morganella psychrotolerans]|uniref:23S rRNA (uracil(747)-C(5))-methyltransferase RlmC n=1 Tax=Morganella psychrotolerans TaxID=368603 RepID=A0A1B8HDY6_9GAMM|nr:23S rRNA (uracil(747)-C(5))-methyltransferase RlmC [Morganella psychrotolerans]OBU07288.1 23S rRNA (uracil(747)-C(5))-methyltransferase [Morganella psychrotolerans]
MHCPQYSAGRCRSCQWLDKSYSQQLDDKQQDLHALLSPFAVQSWLTPARSEETQFRNKAKMVVSGSVERPVFGIVTDNEPVDLSDCPLYPPQFSDVFAALKPFIARAGLTPYNVTRRRGELKFLLLTQSRATGDMMLRFVLRSDKKIAQLQAALPELQTLCPKLTVISANIQPVHMAILEGEQEIIFTPEQALEEIFNGIPLYIRPHSFFQTNPVVAAHLYHTAGQWVRERKISRLWDLFCGAGGFGLHCADKTTHLTGIEISPEAIACATRSAEKMGLENVTFQALDSSQFALGKSAVPELVLVNPPRRGIGKALCDYLNTMAPDTIIYSSCNAQSLAQDLMHLPLYQPERVQLFDMFPHTAHYEVLVLLTKK